MSARRINPDTGVYEEEGLLGNWSPVDVDAEKEEAEKKASEKEDSEKED